ncbi:MAG TPA: hypothetical protein VGX76_09575 [Pirellulales bacterium]|jgi:hypothetical protein|nr:hypothetical protein [Pirellulales bacterium]
MNWSGKCPPLEELRRVALGLLSQRDAAPIEEHLVECEACVALLDSASPSDGFVEAIRRAPRVAANADQQAADSKALLARARQALPLWLNQSKSASAVSGDTEAAGARQTPQPDEPSRESLDFLSPPLDGGELGRLTGQPPFKGRDPLAVLTALATTTPAAPCDIVPYVSSDLSDLVMRMLSKDAAERPVTAAAVVDAIERTEAEQMPTAAMNTGLTPPARLRRRGILIAFAAAAFILLAGVIVIVLDKDGDIVAWFRQPDGGSIVIRPDDGDPAPVRDPKRGDATDEDNRGLTPGHPRSGSARTAIRNPQSAIPSDRFRPWLW